MAPTLLTFDIFGTVVDWRAGLRADLGQLAALVEQALGGPR
jgi:FMN phosphatase YigB (HAD superfamily)